MAYISQERKAELVPAIKKLCKNYGIKASVAVNHHSTLVVNIKSGKLDLCGNYFSICAPRYAREFPGHTQLTREQCTHIQVNPYWAHEQFFGKCRDFIVELLRLMNIGNHDNSDIQSDYFDVGWYKSVNIGQWNKPYQVIK